MNRLVYALSALVCALILTASATAQSPNVTGDWDVTINSPQGARTGQLSLKQDGEKLTGKIKNQRGETPLEGEVKGKEIKFKYTVKLQDQDLVISMSGNIDGDAMKGDADFGGLAQGDWNAKRASAAAASGAAPAAAAQSSADKGGEKSGDKIKLTGRYKGLLGEFDVTGTVKGDKIEFSFKATGQVEGSVNYAGTTDGKTMKGKVSLAGLGEGTFTGKKQ